MYQEYVVNIYIVWLHGNGMTCYDMGIGRVQCNCDGFIMLRDAHLSDLCQPLLMLNMLTTVKELSILGENGV